VHNASRVFGIQILKYKWEKAYIMVREGIFIHLEHGKLYIRDRCRRYANSWLSL